MPDTHYAKHRQRSKALPTACAMISFSLGHRAGFFLMFREARRSTPMMAADRSTRSFRAILFLIVSFGLPSLAAAETLEDSAKEFAQKIAAALPGRENVSCEIRNLSSLKTDETARVEQTLKAELQNGGIRILSSGSTTSVVVTLSENFKNLIWTAEIREDDTTLLVLMASQRILENRGVLTAMPVTIRSEKFWEGPERILDAMIASAADGPTRIILFLPDGLAIQDVSGSTTTSVKFPAVEGVPRDPQGFLELHQNVVRAAFPFRDCTVNLESLQLRECHTLDPTDHSVGDMGTVTIGPVNLSIPGRVSTAFLPGDVCGAGLTTSSGDDTQRDWVQALSSEPPGVAISNKLDFPGPVLALRSGSEESRAIVRNLNTGNYEAYRLSFSCGQ